MHYVWKILLNGKGFSKISIEKGEYVEVLLLCTYFSCVYMNLCHYVSMNMGVYPMTLLHKTRTVRKHQNSRHNNNYLVAYAQDYIVYIILYKLPHVASIVAVCTSGFIVSK